MINKRLICLKEVPRCNLVASKNSFHAPFVIYVDFESNLEKVDKNRIKMKLAYPILINIKNKSILLAVMVATFYIVMKDLVNQFRHTEAKIQFTVLLEMSLRKLNVATEL